MRTCARRSGMGRRDASTVVYNRSIIVDGLTISFRLWDFSSGPIFPYPIFNEVSVFVEEPPK